MLLSAYVTENRDGDVVKIRVSEDVLDIQENHLPDPTIVRPDSEVHPEEKPLIDVELEEEEAKPY